MVKILFFFLVLSLYSKAQEPEEDFQNFEKEKPNQLEVLDRFPRFRVQYNFEKAAREVEAEVEKESLNNPK